jgi:hypothetical protein
VRGKALMVERRLAPEDGERGSVHEGMVARERRETAKK